MVEIKIEHNTITKEKLWFVNTKKMYSTNDRLFIIIIGFFSL